MFKILFLIAVLLSTGIAVVKAQQPPFWSEIKAFRKADSLMVLPPHPIVFVGSSSFQKWNDVQAYFPKHHIINRGFGGSSFPDVMRYADDVIFKYNPEQVVIYCGDNDLASSDSVTADTVFNRFKELFTLIRERLPNTSVVFVSIKPSPSRVRLMPEVEKANGLIKNFLHIKPHTAFVDVYHKMLEPDGKPTPGLFLQDSLHMNPSGYKIWQKQIEPVLLK